MRKRLKDTDRREVREDINCWDRCKFDGDLDGIICDLQNFRDANKKYHRIGVDENSGCGYYGETWTEYEITGFRWETDEELEKRVAKAKVDRKKEKEKKAKAVIAKEVRARKQLAELKAKFE